MNKIHLADTLGIIEPNAIVYMTKDPNNYHFPYYLNYKVFDNNIVPSGYEHYNLGEVQLNNFMKESYQIYLNCFQNKVGVKITSTDSIIIDKQLYIINKILKNNLIKELQMPDSLYNCLLKYGYKQYLITYVTDYYYVAFVEPNVYSSYRLFIFDMMTKSLSFYNYTLNAADGPIALLIPNNVKYCYLNRGEGRLIKKYNRRINRANKKNLHK